MDNKDNKDNIVVLSFSEAKQPVFKERRGTEWVSMDLDDSQSDNYPEYLLNLIKNSPKHGAIVSGKSGYIYGKGLKAENETDREKGWLTNANRYGQGLNAIVKKSVKDVETFYGFYWQIIPKLNGGFEIYNLDWRKVRKDKEGKGFYYKKDGKWKDKKVPAVFFDTFYPGIKTASIFAYYEYNTGQDDYPEPEYFRAANYIEADIEVSRQVLANAQGGFSASKLVNLYNGEPTNEKKKEIEKTFEKKFTGARGKKFVITFNNKEAKAPDVLDLGSSDLTKEDFGRVDKLIEQNIFTAHRVTSPILFGIKTEGQLGGRNEMREAYEIFKNTYANEKQQNIEDIINFFGSLLGMSKFTFMPVEPIAFEFSEATLLAVAPKRWLIDKIGIDSKEYPEVLQPTPGQPAGQGMTNEAGVNSVLTNLTAKQHQQVLRIMRQHSKGQLTLAAATALLKGGYGFTDDDIKALLGIGEPTAMSQSFDAIKDDELIEEFSKVGVSKSGYNVIKSRKVLFSTDNDAFEDELMMFKTDFKGEVSDREARVLEIIKKDKRVTPEVIASTLKISVDDASSTIKSLTERGLLKVSTVNENGADVEIKELEQPITEVTEPEQRIEIKILYSYEGPQDDRNRAFCAKMLELDRFYTRVDIENISERLGYSVWDRRGGFWNDNGKVKPYCRHNWFSQVVLKKKNNE